MSSPLCSRAETKEKAGADKERIPRAFKRRSSRKPLEIVSECSQSFSPFRLFSRPLPMPEAAKDRSSLPDHCRIRREYHVRQAIDRLRETYINPQLFVAPYQSSPLRPCFMRLDLTLDSHPGVDLVLNSVPA